ncbi:MAG: hypothetical protein AAGD28_25440 [Bacteroidota bacterium]
MISSFRRILPYIFFTFLLGVGFMVPSCEFTGGPQISPCNCDRYAYFDINGLQVDAYEDFSEGTVVDALDTLNLAQFGGIYVDYQVEYHANLEKPAKSNWSFSLMNTAYACTCIPGPLGSKREELVNFQILTLNDFDEDHKANDDINDLLQYQGNFLELDNSTLEDFLNNSDGKIESEDMLLALTKAPELNPELKLKVIMELSTGEIYEAETAPFFLIP